MENPIKMDDLGVYIYIPLFLETPICFSLEIIKFGFMFRALRLNPFFRCRDLENQSTKRFAIASMDVNVTRNFEMLAMTSGEGGGVFFP